MSRDFHLGDVVAYPAQKRGRPRVDGYGRVDGFRLRGGQKRGKGMVEVLGDDGVTRSFGRNELHLVRPFDQ